MICEAEHSGLESTKLPKFGSLLSLAWASRGVSTMAWASPLRGWAIEEIRQLQRRRPGWGSMLRGSICASSVEAWRVQTIDMVRRTTAVILESYRLVGHASVLRKRLASFRESHIGHRSGLRPFRGVPHTVRGAEIWAQVAALAPGTNNMRTDFGKSSVTN